MITKVKFRNFQPHRKLEITLGRITFIVGPSRKGKSSIIRGIRWVCLGKPSGIRMITHGKDKCKVELTVDGNIVTRQRGVKSPSVYKLNGSIFRAAGTSVPQEIADLLNLSEINFQKQLDAHFWIADTPQQIAKSLNEIVNLEDIDSVLTLLASKVRKTSTLVEVTESRVVDLKQKVDELKWVESFGSDLSEIQQLQDKHENALKRSRSLDLILSRGKVALRGRSKLLGAKTEAAALLSLASEHRKGVERRKGLERLLVQHDKILLAEARSNHESIRQRVDQLAKVVEQLKALRRQSEKTKRDLTAVQSKLAKVKKCPLCNQPLNSSSSLISTCHTTPPSPGKTIRGTE